MNEQLGISAKISGRRDCARNQHLVCVYTADWRDVADVQRVGETLISLGAARWSDRPDPYYTADEQTEAGMYFRKGDPPLSLYRINTRDTTFGPFRGLRFFAMIEPEAAELIVQLEASGMAVPEFRRGEEEQAQMLASEYRSALEMNGLVAE